MRKFWSIKLFRLFGIQLELHLTFLLLLIWVAYEGWMEAGVIGGLWSTSAIILIFSCVVLHELGHCLVARAYRIPIYRILLLPIGGMAQFGNIPRHPVKELLITLAGPSVNFAIGALLYFGMGQPALWFAFDIHYDWNGLIKLLLVFNFLMGLFNLLPVFPMDGGRILRALLALRLSYLASTRLAVIVAKPLALAGIIVALFYLNNWITAALFAFIFIGGELEYSLVKRREAFRGVKVFDIVEKDFVALDVNSTVGEALDLTRERPAKCILLIQDERVRGIIDADTLSKLATRGYHDEILLPKARKRFTVLQAEWPLELFADSLLRNEQLIYPVCIQHRVIGILDSTRMNDYLDWKFHPGTFRKKSR